MSSKATAAGQKGSSGGGAGAGAATTTEEGAKKILEDAKSVIKVESFFMKRCLDSGKLMDALKHASNFVSELRTSLLSPKDYYSLYIEAFDELRYLESYLCNEKDKPTGKKMSELYELVQYAGNILPRLYLLVTVASAYIKPSSNPSAPKPPVKDVLRDVVEMCKGVQHPTRGLFLRNYLSEMTKDKLPDGVERSPVVDGVPNHAGSSSSSGEGDVRDSVEFVMCNFTEMNKLWVRLHMGPTRERERRESEREELRILVGKNLSRLGQLEGVDVRMYKDSILPRILDQVVQCKDRLAQQYLMEIIVQIFPDDFHLSTLAPLLSATDKLVARVDVKTVVASLVDRLQKFVESNFRTQQAAKVLESADVPIPGASCGMTPRELFRTIEGQVELLAGSASQETGSAKISTPEYLTLQTGLASLCLKCFPKCTELVNEVLANSAAHLTAHGGVTKQAQPQSVETQITNLLKLPVEVYANGLSVLRLLGQNFIALTAHLTYKKRKLSQLNLVRSLTSLTSLEDVELVYRHCSALLTDNPRKKPPCKEKEGDQDQEEEQEDEEDEDTAELDGDFDTEEDFEEEQNTFGGVVHRFSNPSDPVLFDMYVTLARKHYLSACPDPQKNIRRLSRVLPPLIFACLRVVLRQGTAENQRALGTQALAFVNEMIKVLRSAGDETVKIRCVKYYLECAMVASSASFDATISEFVTEALSVYEDDITGSADQSSALSLIIATLTAISGQRSRQGEENEWYQNLSASVAKHSLKLLRKPDQCRAVSLSSHLFFDPSSGELGTNKRVLECLQKALKIADSSVSGSADLGVVGLFVEILNKYLFFFDKGNPFVTVKYLSGLVSLINTNVSNTGSAATTAAVNQEAEATRAFYKNTLAYIAYKKSVASGKKPGEMPPYADIDV